MSLNTSKLLFRSQITNSPLCNHHRKIHNFYIRAYKLRENGSNPQVGNQDHQDSLSQRSRTQFRLKAQDMCNILLFRSVLCSIPKYLLDILFPFAYKLSMRIQRFAILTTHCSILQSQLPLRQGSKKHLLALFHYNPQGLLDYCYSKHLYSSQ